MKPRVYQTPELEDIQALWHTALPIDVPWGIYARQSTPAQLVKHVQSTEMQTDDLRAWLVTRNVSEQNIRLFDADLGVSGTLRIDQRTGLQDLVSLIEADRIKAVLVYQISRLFRDQTAIQYNVFADICKTHNCLLATADGTLFNFHNPMHMKLFRYLAEMAAEYIPQQIRLLHEARRRKARMGYYAGMGVIPIGYIVDYAPHSVTFQKYLLYHPHSRMVFWFAERYYSLEGDFWKLCREVEQLPVVFEDFDQTLDSRNIIHRGSRRKVPGGYHISRTNLIYILTNPFYLGWRIVKGDVASRNDHPPVFDTEHEYLFWYAFNRLSDYTLTGKKNEQRVCLKEPCRFYQKATIAEAGILKDKIRSTNSPVNCHASHTRYCYIISIERTKVTRAGNIEVDAREVDPEFTKSFFAHMRETRDFDIYTQWVTETVQKHQALINTLESQLAQIGRQQQAALSEILEIKANILETTPDEKERKRKLQEAEPLLQMNRDRITELEAVKKEVLESLRIAQADKKAAAAKTFADFQTELQKLIDNWDKKPLSVRQEFVNLFVEDAILDSISPHWVRLTIVWTHPAWDTDIFYIYRQRGSRAAWTDEERETLHTYYPTASQETIMQHLPTKTWHSITQEAQNVGVKRAVWKWYEYPHGLSWDDIIFMQEKGIELSDRSTKYETSSRPLLLA